MKYILVFSLAAFLFGGCIKTNYIDMGLADGNYDGTLLDYLESCPGTWDSAVVAIRHAGLESLFDGTSGEYPDGITFFGFTNYSVRNFLYETRDAMWQQMYRSVREIPADVCCRMVLQYVIPGRYVLDDFAYEVKGDYRPGDPMVKGGTEMQSLAGLPLVVFRTHTPYNGVPDAGPDRLGIYSPVPGREVKAGVASCNIVTRNAVVHALETAYIWKEL